MVALPLFTLSRMTVAEFLDWPGDGSGARFELVDGELQAMAPASGTHGTLQATFARLLGNHLSGTGCRVVTAPGVVPRLRSSENMRIPDLAVTCVPDAPAQAALPDPVVIIEILSPSSEAQTRSNVWAYASIPSVRHILLVQSTSIAAELLTRQPDDWPPQPLTLGPADRLLLDSISFDAALIEVYADTHLAGSPP